MKHLFTWADRYNRCRELEKELGLTPCPDLKDMDGPEIRAYLEYLWEIKYPRCIDEGQYL